MKNHISLLFLRIILFYFPEDGNKKNISAQSTSNVPLEKIGIKKLA